MKKIINYFNEYLEAEKRKGVPKYKTLKELGLKPSAIDGYQKGSVPNDEPVVKLAIKMGIEPALLLTLVAGERATNKETKRIWFKIHNEMTKNSSITQKLKISQEISLESR